MEKIENLLYYDLKLLNIKKIIRKQIEEIYKYDTSSLMF